MGPSSAQGPRCPPVSNCRGTDDHCRSSYGEHPETGNWDALTRNSHGLLVSYIRAFALRSGSQSRVIRRSSSSSDSSSTLILSSFDLTLDSFDCLNNLYTGLNPVYPLFIHTTGKWEARQKLPLSLVPLLVSPNHTL